MPDAIRELLKPMTLAGLCTLTAVAMSMRWVDPAQRGTGWALLAVFVAVFLSVDAVRTHRPRLADALLLALPAIAVYLIAVTPDAGTAQVLLVVWTAQVAMTWPARQALAAVVAADLATFAVLHAQGHTSALTVTLLYAGFQGFAALTVSYAREAERTRDQLSRVNADLLATRALLADSARDGERLRIARELHDVAGHTLTAMRLNLRALGADPALAARPEVQLVDRLSAELMGDLRAVVQQLRDSRGLDLETAIRALAAPMPRPALRLEVHPDVRVDDPAVADALLRLVQEALTNAARHAHAETLHVVVDRDGASLRMTIEDDGQLRGPVHEGNGIAGMRERIAALHGDLALGRTARGSLRIRAMVPA